MSELCLLLPGLTAPPLPALGQQLPSSPRITRLLSRADVAPLPGVDYESTLCGLFGIDTANQDAPVAAIERVALGLPRDERCWILVEPVCLRPDQSRLLLFDTLDFDVSAQELDSLGRSFAEHFQRDGRLVEVNEPGRWYLSPPAGCGVRSHSLGEAFGRNMDLFLPRGEGRLAWHALLNEAQMLLFSDPVNIDREALGKMPVNGVWLSGSGPLPAAPERRYERIHAAGLLARGVASLAGVALDDSRPPDPQRRLQLPTLAVYDRLWRPTLRADPFAWWEELLRLERWLESWLAALRSGRLESLRLSGCDGTEFRLRRRHLLRFWRATRPLSGWAGRK